MERLLALLYKYQLFTDEEFLLNGSKEIIQITELAKVWRWKEILLSVDSIHV